MRSAIFFALLVVLSGRSAAQLVQARIVSSGYAWQQQDTAGQSVNHLYGYQTIQLSAATEDFSFHTYWQGYNDFAGPLSNTGQYRLFNLYLRANNILDILDLSVGRQNIFAGVGTGSIDGGLATVKLLDSRVRIIGYYGGLPPPTEKSELIDNAKSNYMVGSQVVGNPLDFAQVSLSYMRRSIQQDVYTATRSDSLFNPYLVEIRPSAQEEEYWSGDVNVDYQDWISGSFRYDYDALFKNTSRVEFFGRINPIESWGITAEYLKREPRISYNSIFSAFTYNTLSDYDLGVEYAVDKNWQAFARYGYLAYDDVSARSVTVGANGRNLGCSLSRNVGYSGEISAASFNAGLPLFDNQITPTLMVSYAQYKLNESTTLDGALSTALGVVYRPLPVLSVDTQVQWIDNKVYQNDTRIFIRLSYLFIQRLDLL